MSAQLVLPMGLDDARGLKNYLDVANRELVAYLKQQLLKRSMGQQVGFTGILIRGAAGSGKSHLLAALSEWTEECGGETVHLTAPQDLKQYVLTGARPQVYLLDGLENFLQDGSSERELMTFIERLKQGNRGLVMCARQPVNALCVDLADLRSRLLAMESFELHPLGDDDKREVLRQRASQRGILLSEDVLNWLFTHTGRELGILLDLLEQIDVLSLAEKRRVTIPLIKSILMP